MGIKIVTDSTADLSKELIERYNIEIVPLTVNFENDSFRDGVDISSEEFFDKLKGVKKLPSTSQVNPGEFVELFKKIIKNGDKIIGIFISSTLSGTCNSAIIAKEMIDSKDIAIIDSKTSSIELGLLALEAAKAVKEDKKFVEIIDIVKDSMKKAKIIFMLDTLEYLRKGGRLSIGKAVVGDLLNLKLLMTVEDGIITLMAKVRGRKKGIKWICDFLSDEGIILKNGPVAFVHGDGKENLDLLKKRLSESQDISGGDDYLMGAVIGTHLGPGCIGLGYINKN